MRRRFENYFSVAYLGSNALGRCFISIILQPETPNVLRRSRGSYLHSSGGAERHPEDAAGQVRPNIKTAFPLHSLPGLLVQTLGMAACLVIAILTKVLPSHPPPPLTPHPPPSHASNSPPPPSGSSEWQQRAGSTPPPISIPFNPTLSQHPFPFKPQPSQQLTLWLLVAAAIVCGLSTAVMESGAHPSQHPSQQRRSSCTLQAHSDSPDGFHRGTRRAS